MNRVAIFRELDEEQVELLSPLFEEVSCRPGTLIFQQGDQAEFLYLIIDGKVDMSYKPYDGVPITIGHVGTGDLFGWSAVIGSEKYTSTAVAIESVAAFRVHGCELRKFCLQHPEAGRRILESLANGVSSRWKDAQNQVKSLLFQGLTQNLNCV
jgi:CRP/FNR family transcriptional regulator